MGAGQHFCLRFLEQHSAYGQVKHSPARQRQQLGEVREGWDIPSGGVGEGPPPPGQRDFDEARQDGAEIMKPRTRDKEVTRVPFFQTGLLVRRQKAIGDVLI